MILVTGGMGFVASHLINSLDPSEVVTLVRMNQVGTPKRLQNEGVRVVWHDLRSPLNDQTIKDIGPIDHVVHMGAQTHVDRSITDPGDFVMSNLVGTFNLLEYARKIGLKGRFVQFSTDEVFGPAPDGMAYAETSFQMAKNPYAATKAGAEQLAWAWANTYGLNVSVVRSMNIFGPMQDAEKFIPLCIRKILLGETISIHANKDRTRSGSRYYIHASDVAEAVKLVLISGQNNEAYHCFGGEEIFNAELAMMIGEIMELSVEFELVDFHSSRPGHDLRYALTGNNLAGLGWSAKKPFAQGLRETVNWYLQNRDWLGL